MMRGQVPAARRGKPQAHDYAGGTSMRPRGTKRHDSRYIRVDLPQDAPCPLHLVLCLVRPRTPCSSGIPVRGTRAAARDEGVS
jgi:hypothetical protein